jgi:hypothetical protein
MIKKVYIDTTCYTIDCDLGSQDIAWLAISACHLHGMDTFPISRYIPCMAKNSSGVILHPKLVLFKSSHLIGDEIYVKIRPALTDFDKGDLIEEEKVWYRQAFTNERFLMNVKVRLSIANEFKGKEYLFAVTLKYKIHPHIYTWFPQYENKETIVVLVKEFLKDVTYVGEIIIPFGTLEYTKFQFGTSEESFKDCLDFKKNQIIIEKLPDPMLVSEREDLLIKKEQKMRELELKLIRSIKEAEDKQIQEENKLKELEDFLNSLPYSLEEIYDYSKKEISDADKELITIFATLERDEYKLFRKLFEIFKDYCKYYDVTDELVEDFNLDFEALIHFYKTYFSKEKYEMSSLTNDFSKYYAIRAEEKTNYNFLDFIYSMIYLMYSLYLLKSINIEKELCYTQSIHEKKMEDEAFYSLYKDDVVILILSRNMDFLKSLFKKYSTLKIMDYHEMKIEQLLNFIKDLALANKLKYEDLISKLRSNEDKCLFDFLEIIIRLAMNVDPNEEVELTTKLDNFILMLRETFPNI